MIENGDSNFLRTDDRHGTEPEVHAGATDGGLTAEAQANFDPAESRSLTTVIIEAIAEAEGVSITEVLSPPLYEVVDVEAMEVALFGPPGAPRNGTASAVEFQYNDYKVSVVSDGWVTVSRRKYGTTAD